jgi:uncharacterized protein (DUF2249 family)
VAHQPSLSLQPCAAPPRQPADPTLEATAAAALSAPGPSAGAVEPTAVHTFDTRGIAVRVRKATVVGALDSLQPGEVLRLACGHDPVSLLAPLALLARRDGRSIAIEYRHRRPGAGVVDLRVR